MLRSSILLSVRHELSLRARLFVALLALVQVIAPTWHVCEMGGSACCPPEKNAEKLQCHLPPEAGSTPGPARCAQHLPQTQASAPQTFLDAVPIAHAENCLAKLLLGMPWQTVSTNETGLLRALHVGSTPSAPRLVSLSDLPQPPSRGPPVFFL